MEKYRKIDFNVEKHKTELTLLSENHREESSFDYHHTTKVLVVSIVLSYPFVYERCSLYIIADVEFSVGLNENLFLIHSFSLSHSVHLFQ